MSTSSDKRGASAAAPIGPRRNAADQSARTADDGRPHEPPERRSERTFRVLGLAPEGFPIILFIATGCLLIAIASVWAFGRDGSYFAIPCAVVSMWSVWFFRDPDREINDEPGAILSPADGIVVSVKQAAPPPELGIDTATAGAMTRVSIFLTIFDVHVNRIPVDARVVKVAHHKGRFINASLNKSSVHNERCAMLLELEDGRPIVCVQIAGIVTRRIVCKAQEGTMLLRGDRYGIIKFGSRVDVYVPRGFEPTVRVGERAIAAKTVIASSSQLLSDLS